MSQPTIETPYLQYVEDAALASFGTPSSVQTASNATGSSPVATNSGGALGDRQRAVIVFNLGASDLVITVAPNTVPATIATWVVPAGVDRTIPVVGGTPLYAATLASGAATTFCCTEVGVN